MSELAEADRYLLEQIGRGNPDGWQQLVTRYQGRLLAFARSRLKRQADAEDLVQDTFVAFLQSIKSFDKAYSLETYLFTILRRRLIDLFRGKAMRVAFLGDSGLEDDSPQDLPARDLSASWYVRRDEAEDAYRKLLAAGLSALITRLREAENFRDLRVIELLFYAQARNKDIGVAVGLDEKQIALIKFRALAEIRRAIVEARGDDQAIDENDAGGAATSLLTEVWEEQRLTCPKRTTIGRQMLGTLEEPWKSYVEFHVDQIGCQFCRANRDDLRQQTADAPKASSERIYQSTIGFFRKV